MMNWLTIPQRSGRAEVRVAVTWLGAAIVLGCGLWLASRGGSLGLGPRTSPAAEAIQEVGWIDQRLAMAQGPGASDSPLSRGRIAALHWDRATRLAQSEYYRRGGLAGTDSRPSQYAAFLRQFLQKDRSGDVAATREAATRALARMLPGRERVRPLWLLSMACSAGGHWQEAIGALIEITCYKPAPPWVWRLLAEQYGARGDFGRQDLAAEQAWRASTGRRLSPYINVVIRHTPYARPAVCPAGRKRPEVAGAVLLLQ